MSDVANKLTCVCLDSVRRPIGYKTTKDAIVSLCEEVGKDPTWFALDIEYSKTETGEWNFSECISMIPTTWSDWVTLPVRDFDFSITAGNSKGTKQIRVPTIIVSKNFCKTVYREIKLTKSNIAIRDNHQCQYTGRLLSKGEGDIDHVKALSRGGKNVWENVVYCDKKINAAKGNKTLEEAGLKLIRRPTKPSKELMNAVKRRFRAHADWNLVLGSPE